jgi:hypothetical protein
VHLAQLLNNINRHEEILGKPKPCKNHLHPTNNPLFRGAH